MRASFVKSIRKTYSEKPVDIKVQKFIGPELNGISNQKITDGSGSDSKKQKGRSFDVSFNLDQMYFESDKSTEQNTTQKSAQKRKQTIDQIQVQGCKNIKPQCQPKAKALEIKFQKSPQEQFIEECFQQQLSSKSLFQSGLHLQNHTKVISGKCKDQQAQADFPQIEYDDSDDSVHELSQIDMLFIFPQNISRYNQNHHLFVTVSNLAKIYPLDIELKKFVKIDPKCVSENEQKLFSAFIIDWEKSQDRLSKKILTLAKMRTIIIRDAMNNLVDEIVPPVQTEDYHLRISKTYRARYIKAKIPIPPPRVNNTYLQGLFSKAQIRTYYQNYVDEKLQMFLKQQNYRKIQIYTFDLIQCLRLYKDKSLAQLVQILERKKKPFTNKQIELILEQARKIGYQYGRDAKRIGNGIRHNKKHQKSKKFLNKKNTYTNVKLQYFSETEQGKMEAIQDSDNLEGIKKLKKQKIQQVKIEAKIQENTHKKKVKKQCDQSKNVYKRKNRLLNESDKIKIQ